jgi:hypothetical protein
MGETERMSRRRNRMNVTFTKLASDFDAALQEYRDAEHELGEAQARRERAATAMREARDTLLEAYPELAQGVAQSPAPAGGSPEWRPPGGGGVEFVEVDDPDDVPGPR